MFCPRALALSTLRRKPQWYRTTSLPLSHSHMLIMAPGCLLCLIYAFFLFLIFHLRGFSKKESIKVSQLYLTSFRMQSESRGCHGPKMFRISYSIWAIYDIILFSKEPAMLYDPWNTLSSRNSLSGQIYALCQRIVDVSLSSEFLPHFSPNVNRESFPNSWLRQTAL